MRYGVMRCDSGIVGSGQFGAGAGAGAGESGALCRHCCRVRVLERLRARRADGNAGKRRQTERQTGRF